MRPKRIPGAILRGDCSYSSFTVPQIASITNGHPDEEGSGRATLVATPRNYCDHNWVMKEDFSGIAVSNLDIVTDG